MQSLFHVSHKHVSKTYSARDGEWHGTMIEEGPKLSGAKGPSKRIDLFGRYDAVCNSFQLRARQTLNCSGKPRPSLCLARTGLLIRRTQMPDRRAPVSSVFYPGDLFTMPQIDHANISAVVPSQVSWIDHKTVDSADINDLIAALASQCERQLLHANVVSLLSPIEKVASFLIEYASRLGTPAKDSIVFDLVLSRLEIADYLILNGDTVSRVMARMKADGVLRRLTGKRVLVPDRAKLYALTPLAQELSQALSEVS